MNEQEIEPIENSDQLTRAFMEDALDLEQRQKNLEKLESMKMIEDLIASMPRAQRRKFIREKFSDRVRNAFKKKNEPEGI